MSKRISFVVTVEFQDHINNDKEVEEVGRNISDAVISHINTAGIVPENSETFTTNVSVSHSGIEITNEKIFLT